MLHLIKNFCKGNNLKFEDFNENSSILVTSKICKKHAYKDTYNFCKGKKGTIKYRFFTYYRVINYETYIDCITVHTEKKPVISMHFY